MTITDGPIRNGVDTATLFATVDAVRAAPEAAAFRFRATNEWVNGTNSRTTVHGFFGTGQELTHIEPYTYEADHPQVLVGADRAASPPEFLLHALAGCITAGIANVAAARGVHLESVTSTVEGDIDLRGVLGLDEDVRNGYQRIRIAFTVRGDDPAALAAVVEQSRKRSTVFDVLTNGVPIDVTVDAG
jgi:uncharacterized OsmC-like protein